MDGSQLAQIAQLRQELLLLQGHKSAALHTLPSILPAAIQQSFPQHRFPTAVIHEWECHTTASLAATAGFITTLLSKLSPSGPFIWITPKRKLFPPALQRLGMNPTRLIFIEVPQPAALRWALHTCLQCKGIPAVIAEPGVLDFLATRKLQLAAETSGVTCFLVQHQYSPTTTAAAVRWRIQPAPSEANDLPGPGFPRWQVELVKMRNGKTGQWTVEWNDNNYELIAPSQTVVDLPLKKIG